MRILAIRGENLASLAARFQLDLGEGPLGSTGIFAITGETGAGKSTILDALCLALYGQYPRVSGARREDVPDPGGQTLTTGDGRAILRRGAGSGFAEVDFLAQDGVAYRARWAVYRARNRVNGRLQAESRTLVRIADKSALASSKTQVSEAVERLTDLTFDQFRRTVVLAQGEFDAFLLASEAERADLLEKITGTAIYSEISKQVHSGAAEQRAVLAALTARREAIGHLDADARAALLAELAEIGVALPPLVAEQAALAAALDHARRVAVAVTQLTEAGERWIAAEGAVAEAKPDAERLAAIDAVEPLRGLATEVARTEAEQHAAVEILGQANSEAAAAEAGLATAQAAEAAAREADHARGAEFDAFLPVWSEADGLDAALRDRSLASAAAEARAKAASAASAAAAESRAALDRAHEEALKASTGAADRMEAEAARGALADRAEEIAGLFAKRDTFVAEAAETAEASAAAKARVASADVATVEARARLAQARDARAAQAARRAEHAAAHAAIDVDAAEARLAQVQELLEAVAPIRGLIQAEARAAADLDRAIAARAGAEALRRDAMARREAAEVAHGQAERARMEIVSLADLAESSASPQAARLRSLLLPGEPCPVCGASEHPHGHGAPGSAEDALERVARGLRERRTAIDAELSRAAGAAATAKGDEAAALARTVTSDREAESARDRLADASADYAVLRSGLASAVEATGLAGHDTLPAALDPDAPGWFAALTASARAAREALAGCVERGRDLGRRMDACSRAVAEADSEAAQAERTIAVEAGPRQEALLAAERADTRMLTLSDRLASLTRELTPYLRAAGLSAADLDENAARSADRLAALGAEHRGLRETCRRLDGKTRESAQHLRSAVEAEAVARATWEAETRTARERAAALVEARTARETLLGGEATTAHRARITALREAARATLRAAVDATGAAQARQLVCRAALDHALTQSSRATTMSGEAAARFRAACGARAPEAVAVLLALAPEIREDLRIRQDALLRTQNAARTALAMRRADLDGLHATPVADVATTEAAAAAVAARLDALTHRRGALDTELARDDADRRGADALATEIALIRDGLEAWSEVDAAIGSANGDRFRRFVQGVTLEHLVQLANVQLRSLNPRYALVRGRSADLALHVIDRDMGDELRGTRSLSGGERFLVALALALALSGLEGRQSFVDTLFIDEGFGSLDAETLDMAVDALETLQGHGRKVGVITHVAAMIDRIAVQVRVEKRGNGRSTVRIVDGALPLAG